MRFPYIALRLASTRNTPICTQCTRTGESLRFAPVPLMPYNFSSICTLSKSAAKAEYGLLLRDRKSPRISPQACKVLADGSALLFVRYRHRNLRPILKPEGQELLFAHRDCFYSRVPNVRVKLCQDVPALPQLVQPAADLFLFALAGMDFGFQPGDLRLQLVAGTRHAGRYTAQYTPPDPAPDACFPQCSPLAAAFWRHGRLGALPNAVLAQRYRL